MTVVDVKVGMQKKKGVITSSALNTLVWGGSAYYACRADPDHHLFS